MAEFLELPDWEGTEVTEGEEIPAGQERPQRTAPFLEAGKELPPKDNLMRLAEKPCQQVIDARHKKEQEMLKRKTRAGEGPSTAMPKRVRRDPNVVEGVISLTETEDANPINQAFPSGGPIQNQPNPEVAANAEENIAPQLSGEENVNHGVEENLGGGINENERSPPVRGNTPPIHLHSPEGNQ